MDRLQEKLLSGVTSLCDAVKVTLGPQGGNVILFSDGMPYLTKDGVSVARQVTSHDPTEFAAIQILREGTSKTAEIAGDGTTTSTILATDIFKRGLDVLEGGTMCANALKKEMLEALVQILHGIEDNSIPIGFNKLQLSYIATTSANNDHEIGDLVAEAFLKAGRDGNVIFELGDSKLTEIETIEGSQFYLGYYNRDFITDPKKGSTTFDNPGVILVNGELTSIGTIKQELLEFNKQGKPVVVFAHDFSEKVIRTFHLNNEQGNLRVLPIKLNGYTDSRKEMIEDLAAIAGVKNFSSTSKCVVGGFAKIITDCCETIIMHDEEAEETFAARAEILKAQVDNFPDNKTLEQQFARFLGKVSVIKVGGDTEVEAKERYDRVEDAVCATKAALVDGICPGGGYTFLKVRDSLKTTHVQSVGKTILLDALKAPFKQLCENAGLNYDELRYQQSNSNSGYDFLNNKFCNLMEAGIVDPTRVLKAAITNAVSVASMLLTTKCIVIPQ